MHFMIVYKGNIDFDCIYADFNVVKIHFPREQTLDSFIFRCKIFEFNIKNTSMKFL